MGRAEKTLGGGRVRHTLQWRTQDCHVGVLYSLVGAIVQGFLATVSAET